MPCVIRYPDGRFQGYPRPFKGTTTHPKVEPLDKARVYADHGPAALSIAHKGGVVLPVAVVLLEPKQ